MLVLLFWIITSGKILTILIDRWVAVKLQYMDIRDTLAKKRLHKRNYGIFVDYDALDKLDDENSDEE